MQKTDLSQVSQVDPAVDLPDEGYQPRNKDDEYNYRLCKATNELNHIYLPSTNCPSDEPEKYRDAPISLQLVARRCEDEKLIQALESIKGKVQLPLVDFTK